MMSDVFDDLKGHYAFVADELRYKAKQAAFLKNPTGVGTEREEVYRDFLGRHLPKMCDVFLGGYLFDLNGSTSGQMDVIVTSDNTPRFRMPEGNRHIAPLEGSIAVAEIKSRLDKESLHDALEKCASIPPMPDSERIVPPYLQMPDERWRDTPYKIVFAYDGISPQASFDHIMAFYNENVAIPTARQPNLVHVLGKYVIIRTTRGMTVVNPNGQPDPNQPNIGQYKVFTTAPDVSAIGWILNELQQKAFLSNHLLFKYDSWHNKVMERIQRELAN